jgi:hypothetical protein
MPDIPLIQAPQAPSISSPSVSVGTSGPSFLNPVSAPNLSLQSISSPTVNITGTVSSAANLNLSGIGQQLGTPTSIGQVASGIGMPTSLPPVGQALNTLGVPSSLPSFNAALPQMNVNLQGLQFPKLPEFPGIDMAGINLGAGPKFIGEQIAKYKTIVPPFAPGLKINMGMAAAAISVLKAAMSANPSELVKHLLSGVVDDLKSQVGDQLKGALDSTGANNLKSQVGGVEGQLSGVVDSAKDSFVDQFNRANPPQTTTDPDGNTIEIPAPKPDLSGFPDIKVSSDQGQGILQSASSNVNQSVSNVGSNLKAFTFPPNS